MQLMYFLLFCNILLLIWNIVRYLICIYELQIENPINHQELSYEANFYFIIPCFKEQSVIKKTIDHFEQMTRNHKNRVKVIIVTTEKENIAPHVSDKEIDRFLKDIKSKVSTNTILEKYNKFYNKEDIEKIRSLDLTEEELRNICYKTIQETKSTYELVDQLLKKNELLDNFYLWHYPYKNGNMASQLNYALSKISSLETIEKNKVYLFVYNADSRPSMNTLSQIKSKVSELKYPKIIQQYSSLMSNIHSLSPIMKGFSIFQTNFEITNGYVNAKHSSIFLRNHVVGHGLGIRLDFLDELGGFNTDYWCEDIYLTFYLKCRNIPIYTVNSLDYGETPFSLISLMKQNANWYKTLSDTFEMYKKTSTNIKYKFNAILAVLNQIRGLIAWIMMPIIYWGLSIYLLFNKKFFTTFVFVVSMLSIFFIRYYGTILLIERIQKREINRKVYYCLCGSIAYFISNIGPLYCLIFKHDEKYKTTR